jgi:DNA polymerase III epsilon subunit-like protein
MKPEFYIVVDIEASGPTPGLYAMLSLGAATLTAPPDSFYITLKPDKAKTQPESMKVHGLTFAELCATGVEPKEAMENLADWVSRVTPMGADPVFCAFNAPFDWMFVNDYFHRYLGYNPFGHKALDIKALYMGLNAVTWGETSHNAISTAYHLPDTLSHHALEDALQEANLLKEILKQIHK